MTYAQAGEKTYCENGHHLATFAYDVPLFADGKPEDFQFEPGASFGMTECPTCHGQVCRMNGELYFKSNGAIKLRTAA